MKAVEVEIRSALYLSVATPCGHDQGFAMRHTNDVRIVVDRAVDHAENCQACASPADAQASKLVRDKIPQIIRETGAEPLTRVADAGEYRSLLRAKLVEEVGEFLDSDDVGELADVLEVLLALAGDLGVDRDQLERLRRDKEIERGGFAGRVVLEAGHG